MAGMGGALKEGAHHLKVIFAKPFDADISTFSPPHHPHTDAEKAFLENSLLKNFVFEDLSAQDQSKIAPEIIMMDCLILKHITYLLLHQSYKRPSVFPNFFKTNNI